MMEEVAAAADVVFAFQRNFCTHAEEVSVVPQVPELWWCAETA